MKQSNKELQSRRIRAPTNKNFRAKPQTIEAPFLQIGTHLFIITKLHI